MNAILSAQSRSLPVLDCDQESLFPFKNKGGLLVYRGHVEAYARRLEQQIHDFVQQHNPFLEEYGVYVAVHKTSRRHACLPKLRWRDRATTGMGERWFIKAMRAAVSDTERRRIHEIANELHLLNYQAGAVNSAIRRLRETLSVLEFAEVVRNDPHGNHNLTTLSSAGEI